MDLTLVNWQEAPIWWLRQWVKETIGQIDQKIEAAYAMPIGSILEQTLEHIAILTEWCTYIMQLIQNKITGGTIYVQ